MWSMTGMFRFLALCRVVASYLKVVWSESRVQGVGMHAAARGGLGACSSRENLIGPPEIVSEAILGPKMLVI